MKRSSSTPIRAVVVEDSTATRALIIRILEADGDIVVVGQAASSADAIQRTIELMPDVVTLDLYLPDGGGRHAVEQIMARVPTPILVLSHNVDDRQSPTVIEALVAGALDALPKPDRWTAELEAQLRRTVRLLCKVHVIRHPRGRLAKVWRRPRVRRRIRCPARGRDGGVDRWPERPGHRAGRTRRYRGAGLGGPAPPRRLHRGPHRLDVAGLGSSGRDGRAPQRRARPGRVYVAPGGVHLRLGRGLQARAGSRTHPHCTARRRTSCSCRLPSTRERPRSACC